MPADGVIIGLDINSLAIDSKVVPVEQHRTQARHQAVDNVARLRL